MKLGLITLMNTPSFMNQAVLIRKVFVEHGWEVEILHTDQAIAYPKQSYDRSIALLPLWPRYIFAAARMLAPWISREHLLYGPVDGPYQTNMNLFKVMSNYRIVVPSQFCADCFKRNGMEVLRVIRHGINHDDFKFADDPKYNRLKKLRAQFPNRKILFANINPLHRKGLVHLCKALQILHKKIPKQYVFILHTGLKKAQDQISKLAPHDKIDLKKLPSVVVEDQYARLPFRQIALKTASCDIIVHPSLNEGFGETILEAMVAQRPIVCLDAPAMNELVNDKSAYLFPYQEVKEEKWENGAMAQLYEYDAKELAAAMERAITNPAECKEKAQLAYENSLEYDYRKVYKPLVTL